MAETYYCENCERKHKADSKVGRDHAEPAQEAPEAPVSEENAEGEAEGLEVPEDAEISVKSSRADVYTMGGQYVRTYSKDKHGPNYLQLAQGFAKKKGFRVA